MVASVDSPGLEVERPDLGAASRPASSPEARWSARLALDVVRDSSRSVLRGVRHEGPLRIQRAFHPETNGTCHVLVLHPPGGVAGGDDLEIDVGVEPGARALVTGPAAQKLYRCPKAASTQRIRLRARSGALEWLPQETIAFHGARSRLDVDVELDLEARFVGWDVLCLGRPASGEPFERGWLDQRWRIRRAGRDVWSDRLRVIPGSPLLTAPWGLRGCTTVATLVCTPGEARWLDDVRAAVHLRSGEHFAASALRGAIVCRFLGSQAHRARAVLQSA